MSGSLVRGLTLHTIIKEFECCFNIVTVANESVMNTAKSILLIGICGQHFGKVVQSINSLAVFNEGTDNSLFQIRRLAT